MSTATISPGAAIKTSHLRKVRIRLARSHCGAAVASRASLHLRRTTILFQAFCVASSTAEAMATKRSEVTETEFLIAAASKRTKADADEIMKALASKLENEGTHDRSG
jgi:hypothetical protein